MDNNTELFFDELNKSFAKNTLVKLTIGKYRGEENIDKLYIKPVIIRGDFMLSFLYRYKKKDITKNNSISKSLSILKKLIGVNFFSATLFTIKKDVQLVFNKKLESQIITSGPTNKAPLSLTHNREKKKFINLDKEYLKHLGITDDQGNIRNLMADKYRQINKFIEVLMHDFEKSDLEKNEILKIIDMGSGKGYLTFAIYDYFNNILNIPTEVVGIEIRQDMVDLCNNIARNVGFNKLQFQLSTIQDYKIDQTDILIALHACNNATDDAIVKGIQAKASMIICSPCCHKELREKVKVPEVLSDILKSGILLERECEIVSDGLRALFLEKYSYKSKVFEFISSEHTGKNLMIMGTKLKNSIISKDTDEKIQELKSYFQIESLYLEEALQKI